MELKKNTGVSSPVWRIYPYTTYAWLLAVGINCLKEIEKSQNFQIFEPQYVGENLMTSSVWLANVFPIYD